MVLGTFLFFILSPSVSQIILCVIPELSYFYITSKTNIYFIHITKKKKLIGITKAKEKLFFVHNNLVLFLHLSALKIFFFF